MSITKNPIAWLALVVALGGTSYAATQLPAGSVGTRQLRNGAVIDKKVRARSLTSRVFAPGTLTAAESLRIRIVASPPIAVSCPANGCPTLPAGSSTRVMAQCASGERAVGGGFDLGFGASGTAGAAPNEEVTTSAPTSGDTGWSVVITLTQTSPGFSGQAYAVCASLG